MSPFDFVIRNQLWPSVRKESNAPRKDAAHLFQASVTGSKTDDAVFNNWWPCRDIASAYPGTLAPLDVFIFDEAAIGDNVNFAMHVCPLCGTFRTAVICS